MTWGRAKLDRTPRELVLNGRPKPRGEVAVTNDSSEANAVEEAYQDHVQNLFGVLVTPFSHQTEQQCADRFATGLKFGKRARELGLNRRGTGRAGNDQRPAKAALTAAKERGVALGAHVGPIPSSGCNQSSSGSMLGWLGGWFCWRTACRSQTSDALRPCR